MDPKENQPNLSIWEDWILAMVVSALFTVLVVIYLLEVINQYRCSKHYESRAPEKEICLAWGWYSVENQMAFEIYYWRKIREKTKR